MPSPELLEQRRRLEQTARERMAIEMRFDPASFPEPGECPELDDAYKAYLEAQDAYLEARGRSRNAA